MSDAAVPTTPRVLLDKVYSSESLSDVYRDVDESFDPAFTPAMKDIPQDKHGFHPGYFKVSITWVPDYPE